MRKVKGLSVLLLVLAVVFSIWYFNGVKKIDDQYALSALSNGKDELRMTLEEYADWFEQNGYTVDRKFISDGKGSAIYWTNSWRGLLIMDKDSDKVAACLVDLDPDQVSIFDHYFERQDSLLSTDNSVGFVRFLGDEYVKRVFISALAFAPREVNGRPIPYSKDTFDGILRDFISKGYEVNIEYRILSLIEFRSRMGDVDRFAYVTSVSGKENAAILLYTSKQALDGALGKLGLPKEFKRGSMFFMPMVMDDSNEMMQMAEIYLN